MGLIEFSMNKGDKVTAESGTMVFIKGKIETKTGMRKGGLLKTLKTVALGGESFFVNNFIAHEDNCSLGLTGNVLGDIQAITIDEEFIVQSGAYVASTGDLTLDTKWQGFTRGMFGSNLFMLKTVGTGTMFVNAWGGIFSKKLESGEKMIVDNYQLVGMTTSASYKVTKHGSFKTSIFGGEALVIEVTGPGIVYIQTKNIMEFVRSIIPYLPTRRN
jgi:uncharacterized protein (TIGR00266 family)